MSVGFLHQPPPECPCSFLPPLTMCSLPDSSQIDHNPTVTPILFAVEPSFQDGLTAAWVTLPCQLSSEPISSCSLPCMPCSSLTSFPAVPQTHQNHSLLPWLYSWAVSCSRNLSFQISSPSLNLSSSLNFPKFPC